MKRFIAALTISTVLLAGCGEATAKDNTPKTQVETVTKETDYTPALSEVIVNGRHCIIANGYQEYAISCDWSQRG